MGRILAQKAYTMNEIDLNSAPKGALIEMVREKSKIENRFKANMKRFKEESARVAEQLLVAGVALGSSFGFGYMVSKNPSWGQLGSTGIDTDLALGAGAVLGSFVVGGDTGRYLTAVGIGLLSPWARDMGASMAAPAAITDVP